jgi:hypothetical protein
MLWLCPPPREVLRLMLALGVGKKRYKDVFEPPPPLSYITHANCWTLNKKACHTPQLSTHKDYIQKEQHKMRALILCEERNGELLYSEINEKGTLDPHINIHHYKVVKMIGERSSSLKKNQMEQAQEQMRHVSYPHSKPPVREGVWKTRPNTYLGRHPFGSISVRPNPCARHID